MHLMRLGLPLIAFVMAPVISKGQTHIQVQGHRGCRGLLPENTIPGFLHALELGVDVLELDVVITGDHQVLVSHEPWMNPDICLGPQGQSLRGKSKVNIYQLPLDEIQTYDCGALGNPRFPTQVPRFIQKPTLAEVLQAATLWKEEHPDHPVLFNIEIKRNPKYDDNFHPPVQKYCDLVLQVIDKLDLEPHCQLQSFDLETLEYLHRIRPDLPLSFLVERGTFRRNMKKLSFRPAVYSPKFSLLSANEVSQIHEGGMAVIPWTVNNEQDIQEMIKLGVDGIISDYPDKVLKTRP